MVLELDLEFSDLSRSITSSLTKEEKKNDGIYFTPQSIIKTTINTVKKHSSLKSIKHILEPSCGSGEFINMLSSTYKSAHITGIEYNNKVYHSLINSGFDTKGKSLTKKKNHINIHNDNFLDWIPTNTSCKYNLVIGNPPFYVMKKKDVEEKYFQYFTGRPNIFIIFLVKSLLLLEKNGILAFVLPRNFLNSSYYQPTREFIKNNYKILEIIDNSQTQNINVEKKNEKKFIDTQQETIIFVCQAVGDDGGDVSEDSGVVGHDGDISINNQSYYINRGSSVIFGTNYGIKRMKELTINTKSLHELGFVASVGQIVWNEHKHNLTMDSSHTRLIYATDIVDGKLTMKKYKSSEKKNYINLQNTDKSYIALNEPILTINRGYGVGKYTFKTCIINIQQDYQLENHVIGIKYVGKPLENKNLLDLYNKLSNSLLSPDVAEFISICLGNNAVTTYEMNHVLPISFDSS